ncbi:MAG: hypothetical protein F9K24_21680 [Leptonema illini]|uniref:JAB domain-containing protein n=1 Tax=Leptonema illini TaxID=183 RepID=A0A833LVG6_9LEPT|nr:MAG: hypothetical protein F9K24_21680 [Leptonema illini]
METLHLSDQPVENVFFSSNIELVLPYDIDEKIDDSNFRLSFFPIIRKDKGVTLRAKMDPIGQVSNARMPYRCYTFALNPVRHGIIEDHPSNLGELEDKIGARGNTIIAELLSRIKKEVDGGTIHDDHDEKVIILLSIPIVREENGDVERIDRKAFLVSESFLHIGLKAGVLDILDQNIFVKRDLGNTQDYSEDWRSIEILPIDIIQPFTRELARYSSGLIDAGPNAVMLGVGSLGSALFNLWSRSGWGTWTIIDPDHIKPHNLARHTAFASQAGQYKVDAIRSMDAALWGEQKQPVKTIAGSALLFEDNEVEAALTSAELIIDVTTTLDYPREHGSNAKLPRGISVFLTPSGRDSVLMAEDQNREYRLDEIEPQYYRHILNQPWGAKHLEGNQALFWSGAGCRDLSTVISLEQVSVHAGILGRQIRIISETPEAAIKVWMNDPTTGKIDYDSTSVDKVLREAVGDFQVIWDTGLQEKVRGFRESCLPSETGGVILGYYDLPKRKIYIVDIRPQPTDSEGNSSGFSRGVDGVAADVRVVQERTAHIVNYVGEWHSHPPGTSSAPSRQDSIQLEYLARQFNHDGFPALMLIVGENEERFCIAGA